MHPPGTVEPGIDRFIDQVDWITDHRIDTSRFGAACRTNDTGRRACDPSSAGRNLQGFGGAAMDIPRWPSAKELRGARYSPGHLNRARFSR